MSNDQSHLKILSTFHYVVAGIAALFACFPVLHLIVGIGFLTGNVFGIPMEDAMPKEFAWFGLLFTVIPAAIILSGWAFAICLAVAGYLLSKRRGYMFCLVMAGIACIFTPFGTVLGIFTIIVLTRQSVRELFGQGQVTA